MVSLTPIFRLRLFVRPRARDVFYIIIVSQKLHTNFNFFVLKFAYSKFLLYLCSVKRFNVLKMHAAVVESVDTKDLKSFGQ